MNIKIINIDRDAFNTALAAARTCYSGKNILPDDCVDFKSGKDLLLNIFKAGHHTVFQHTTFTLHISNVSRHIVWRLLHSHQHYNSEQISQRYVDGNKMSFVKIPCDSDNMEKHDNISYNKKIMEYYNKINTELTSVFKSILPTHLKDNASKKAQEIARYVLPQSMSVTMYHTVDLLTIFRYIAFSKYTPECTNEAIRFSQLLRDAVLAECPDFEDIIKYCETLQAEFPNDTEARNNSYLKTFENTVFSRINRNYFETENKINYGPCIIYNMTQPLYYSVNKNYSNILSPFKIFSDPGITGSFSTYMYISLSCDAQNQRHRMSPGYRPLIDYGFLNDNHVLENQIYYVPSILLLEENKHILYIYKECMQYMYEYVKHRKDLGDTRLAYYLPNAHRVRVITRDDFSNFIHKTQKRLCNTAQEEIANCVTEQLAQLADMDVDMMEEFKDYFISKLMRPCEYRKLNNIMPYCPEGSRYCGRKPWSTIAEKGDTDYTGDDIRNRYHRVY